MLREKRYASLVIKGAITHMDTNNLTVESNKLKTIEELKTLTRKLILDYDKWNTDSNKQLSALGQHIINKATSFIEKSELTQINILASKAGIFDFDYDSYRNEIIQEVKQYTREYLSESPSSELLIEYISLASRLGEQPIINAKSNNGLLCVEIYKLRNKGISDYKVDTEPILSFESDMSGLEVAFEKAKVARKAYGINQLEISEFLGCSNTIISQLEVHGIKDKAKELVLGYISYVTYKEVFIKCKLDNRKHKKGKKNQ